MAAFALTNVQVLVGHSSAAYDLSTLASGLEQNSETNLPEANNLAGGGYTHLIAGLLSSQWGIAGLYDTASGGTYTAFTGAQRGRRDVVGFIVPSGASPAENDPAMFGQGQLGSFAGPTGQVGEVARFAANWTGDNALVPGIVGAPLVNRTSTFTGTQRQLGAVGTAPNGATERLWAALFVTAAAGTNLAVTVQSDTTGFASPASAITFTTVSAVGAQFSFVNGPITDDYFRVNATIGSGNFTYCVLMGVW